MLIIDEISLISNHLLYETQCPLVVLFGGNNEEPFAGHSVLVCVNLFQLFSVKYTLIHYISNGNIHYIHYNFSC